MRYSCDMKVMRYWWWVKGNGIRNVCKMSVKFRDDLSNMKLSVWMWVMW